jgi:hypothetical protein
MASNARACVSARNAAKARAAMEELGKRSNSWPGAAVASVDVCGRGGAERLCAAHPEEELQRRRLVLARLVRDEAAQSAGRAQLPTRHWAATGGRGRPT